MLANGRGAPRRYKGGSKPGLLDLSLVTASPIAMLSYWLRNWVLYVVLVNLNVNCLRWLRAAVLGSINISPSFTQEEIGTRRVKMSCLRSRVRQSEDSTRI